MTMMPLCRACGSRRCPAAIDPTLTCAGTIQNAIATLKAFIEVMPAHPGYGHQPHVEAYDALAVLIAELGKVR